MLLVFMLIAALVSACGNKAISEDTTKAAAAQTNQQATDPESETDPKAAQAIKIKHGFGETEVPLHPKRVAVFGLEDIMLSLEAPMVYAYDFIGYYLDDEIQKLNIPVSGSADFKPNLEAILQTNPDLIIVQQYSIDQKGYDELSKIAPTIAFAPDDWKSSIIEIGKALGLEDKAHSVIQANEEELKKAKEQIVQAVGADKTVAYIRPSDKDLQVFFPSFNLVYKELGLLPYQGIAELQQKTKDDWGINLSLEDLPSITADYIFAIYGGSIDTEDAFQKEVSASKAIEELKLWKSIPAVKEDHVFKVSSRHWMSSGPIAESREVDDVVNAVTGKH
ncbi:ABC transporter substrate-binding protein [Paenibacillus dendrobii]|uniref:ABC transporter substrate-binding protein n=1 Tax=Paenibacillus dendrobii TaxID=2691084 RepID=UPI001F1F3ACF|nr:ABC transporter substrate-binding protein [Paenibacillus dendrobii]